MTTNAMKTKVRKATKPTGISPDGRVSLMSPSGSAQFKAYVDHLASPRDGLIWYHRLGQLALACCPAKSRSQSRTAKALAEASPGFSAASLVKVMKLATVYRSGDALRLAQSGVGWDQAVQLIPLSPEDRSRAEAMLGATKMTSRQVRLWKDDQFGKTLTRGGRPTASIPDHGPGVHARVLAADCRRLVNRHAQTSETIESVATALGEGQSIPTAAEIAHYRAAGTASRELLTQVGSLVDNLERITAAYDRGDP